MPKFIYLKHRRASKYNHWRIKISTEEELIDYHQRYMSDKMSFTLSDIANSKDYCDGMEHCHSILSSVIGFIGTIKDDCKTVFDAVSSTWTLMQKGQLEYIQKGQYITINKDGVIHPDFP